MNKEQRQAIESNPGYVTRSIIGMLDNLLPFQEPSVDPGYEAKIKELEALNNNLSESYARLSEEVERDKTTITELRKQRDEHKSKLNSTCGCGVEGFISKAHKELEEHQRDMSLAIIPLTLKERTEFMKQYKLMGYADTDSPHNKCPGMIYFEKVDVNYMCGLPEGHSESHRHISDGIVWL